MKALKTILTILAAAALMTATAQADPAKGQKNYLKYLKPKFQMNGTKFAAEHTQDEWEELFEEKGALFIKEYSEKYPGAKAWLENPENWDRLQDIRDFAIEYGSDSGNVPSCG